MDMGTPKIGNIQEVKAWINSQDWYQEIHLSNGLITPGKYNTKQRLAYFRELQLKGKTFLDVGCNSGAYCLWAKRNGAGRVLGIDVNSKRLEQARMLARIEDLEIEFRELGLFEIEELEKCDVVFCISVLTEIQDLLGAVEVLKDAIGQVAFIELALAKPFVYFSRSKHWLKGIRRFGPHCVFELRETNAGYMICPTIQALRELFGPSFEVDVLGPSIRYDMVRVLKRKNTPA